MQHFPPVETTTIQPLELLHANLWGPTLILSSQDYQYYLSILNDFSKFTWIFPLTTKAKALQIFKDFKTMIENNLYKKIKYFQTDWGSEFRSFTTYLTEQSIQFRRPYPCIHH